MNNLLVKIILIISGIIEFVFFSIPLKVIDLIKFIINIILFLTFLIPNSLITLVKFILQTEIVSNFIFYKNLKKVKIHQETEKKLQSDNQSELPSEEIIEKVKKDKDILQNTLNIPHVFYDNISPDVAIAMSRWLKIFYYQFPEIQLVINGVGEFSELHDYIQKRYEQAEENYKHTKNKENKKILKRERMFYNYIMNIYISMYITKTSPPIFFFEKNEFFEEVTGVKIQGIYLNSQALKEYKVSENFHAKDTNNMEGIIVRELCHIIDLILVVSRLYRIDKLYNELLFSKELSNKLSDSVIPSEEDEKKLFLKMYIVIHGKSEVRDNPRRIEYYKKFVAEALAEYFMSESPREVAMFVGDLMMREYIGFKAGSKSCYSILSEYYKKL